jgi:hypothetical protein
MFLLYRATLLPGVDFGDTPSFQVMGGEPVISPRDAYPLYFAIGSLFVRAGGDPAHAMNLASAVEGAVACGLIVLAGAQLSGSTLAGIAAALLFGGSYTFWSQSIIAEVYALHACFFGLTLCLLFRWESAPTLRNLAWFFGAYALGFGNHLSMILLAPAYTIFLITSAPGGWRSISRPRVIALAAVMAAAGALQYAWNFRALWLQPVPPPGMAIAFRTFWFDVTKSDWRDTMVLRVPGALYLDRWRMYAFDVEQQFGWAGPFLALVGLWHLFFTAPRRAWLLLLLFLVNFAFAFGYNVGDAHVFFLPSHLTIALLAAPALAWLDKGLPIRGIVMALAICVAGVRMHRDYPALDRSGDTRPTEMLQALTNGIDDRRAVLLTDLNWQVQNGLTYYARDVRRDLAMARAADVLLYAPALVADNLAIGRTTILTGSAKGTFDRTYGPLFEISPDPQVRIASISDLVRDLPAGTRYVLSVLKPSRESSVDESDLRDALRILTGGRLEAIGENGYSAVAGQVGQNPALVVSGADGPFRATAALDGVEVTVRMESWLGFDTIRRMGFGHVIVGRQHTLIIERGISFAAFDASGRALRTRYAAGIFAPEPRYIVSSIRKGPPW